MGKKRGILISLGVVVISIIVYYFTFLNFIIEGVGDFLGLFLEQGDTALNRFLYIVCIGIIHALIFVILNYIASLIFKNKQELAAGIRQGYWLWVLIMLYYISLSFLIVFYR